ncbi:MAG: hypothetical protein KAJ95_00635 [Gammaproteobacteria bacterium]|nr:hypothetical protein [Gammaproteobacteria bacterium]
MSEDNIVDKSRVSWLALFATGGTLICCALPILLVTLGFGSVVAALTMQFPLLVTLSEYEGWMFGLSAALLALTTLFIWGRPMHCPAEPGLAARCKHTRVINQRVFWLAVLIWTIGFCARFLLLPLRNLLGI